MIVTGDRSAISATVRAWRAPTGSKVAILFAMAGLSIALLEAWSARNEMYSDGISYLDLGDAFLRGDWSSALNAYWSPLYPVLLGAAMTSLKPSPYWQFPIVHLVNFLIFGFALAAFQYFLAGFLRSRSDGLPEWLWTAIAYTLFLWCTLRLIGVALVSPDLCVAALVFLGAGTLVRIASEPSLERYAVLGLVLGLGYLAKAPMLPMSLAMLSMSAFLAGNAQRATPRIALAGAMFLLTAAPFIYGLSRRAGHPTFGESWALNVAWYVNGVPRYHWQGPAAKHPSRQIFAQPAVYEFNGPVKGTYPVWYDPAYWYAGIKPHLSVPAVLSQIRVNGFDYYQLFFHQQAPAAVVCLALYLFYGRGPLNWILLIPPAVALILYAPVHVEDRMLGAYVVLLWLGLLSSMRIHRPDFAYNAILALVILESCRLGLSVLGVAASHTWYERNTPWEIAQGLRDAGFERGTKVAWIRPHPFTKTENYWWARLAGLQIVAEIPVGQESAFWSANESVRERLMTALRGTGAKALIATKLPEAVSRQGWQPIGPSGYYAWPLDN